MKFQTKYSGNKFWNNILLTQNPQELTGSFLWDAAVSDDVIIDVSPNVEAWLDQISNTPLFQWAAYDQTKEPAYDTGSPPAIAFNGTNNYMGVIINLPPAFTAELVVNNLAPNTNEDLGCIFFVYSIDGIFITYDGAGNIVTVDSNQNGITGLPAADGIQVIIARYDGFSNLELWVNGGTAATGTIDMALDGTESIFVINLGSAAPPFDGYLNGEINWFKYYNSAVDNATIDSDLIYLGERFGISTTLIS
jgi:hypothetical protein